ncbi:MAG: hypothetical protein Q9164_005973, partial [Protoblastenia rupestris]
MLGEQPWPRSVDELHPRPLRFTLTIPRFQNTSAARVRQSYPVLVQRRHASASMKKSAQATLIHKIQHLDDLAENSSPLTNRRKKPKRRDSRRDFGLLPERHDEEGEDGIEWNDSSTLDDEEVGAQRPKWIKNFSTPDGKQAAKAEKKLAKNRIRYNIVAPSDLQHIQHVLHPDVVDLSVARDPNDQGLVNNNTIETNITFNPHCFKWNSLRQGCHEKRVLKNSGSSKDTADIAHQEQKLIQTILQRLRVSLTPNSSPKERKTLLAKLTTAIKADMVAHDNEQAETMQRTAGYWRYVNRRTYNAMVRTNMLWDWATGAKLPEIDESEIGDVIEEDDESLGESTHVSTPPTERSIGEDRGNGDLKAHAEYESFGFDENETPTATSFLYGVEDLHISSDTIDSIARTTRLVNAVLNAKYSTDPKSSKHLEDNWKTAVAPGTTEETTSKCLHHCPETPLKKISDPAFGLDKDSRSFEKTVHPAAPSREKPPTAPPRYYTTHKTPRAAPKSSKHTEADISNTFAILKIETPAPCDDPQLPSHDNHTSSRYNIRHFAPSHKENFPALNSTPKVVELTSNKPRRNKGDDDLVSSNIDASSEQATTVHLPLPARTPAQTSDHDVTPATKKSKVLNITASSKPNPSNKGTR